MFGEIIKLLVM